MYINGNQTHHFYFMVNIEYTCTLQRHAKRYQKTQGNVEKKPVNYTNRISSTLIRRDAKYIYINTKQPVLHLNPEFHIVNEYAIFLLRHTRDKKLRNKC